MYIVDRDINGLVDGMAMEGPKSAARFFRMCRLMGVCLGKAPERAYSAVGLGRRHDNDDDVPSLWWQDATVRGRQDQLRHAGVHKASRRETSAGSLEFWSA